MLDGAGIDRAVGGGRRGATSDQRPASSIAEAAARRRRVPPRLALGERHQERTQAGEAVGGDEAQRDQLGQRLFELRAQQAAVPRSSSSKKEAPLRGNEIDDSLRARARPAPALAGGAIAVHSAAWRRGSRVIGVVRTGASAVAAVAALRGRSRTQMTCPARQRSSSQAGS